MHRACLPLLSLIILMVGCAPSDADVPADAAIDAGWSFYEIPTPAAPGSGEPSLTVTPGGEVLLSWIEPAGEERHALRFARLTEGTWSPPQTIAEGADWFVNWADFPSVVALGNGVLAAHFLARSSDASPYAYDVRITFSDDNGATWQPAVTPHRDGTPTEHGFVSMLPGRDGRLVAAWLDGRHTGGHDGHGGTMTLRTATLAPDGTFYDRTEIDDRVCDCCQTDAARLPNGFLVAYRDRSIDEVRDIAVARRIDGQWETPRRVHDDGWTIQGCPVNGPAVAAQGTQVVVAWFTGAHDTPRVKVSFSDDEGASFGAPVTVDEGRPIGRVDMALLPGGEALVSWIEQTDDGADIRLRRVRPNSTADASVTVAPTSAARASGFPRLAVYDGTVYLAWTQPGEPATVHTAAAPVPGS